MACSPAIPYVYLFVGVPFAIMYLYVFSWLQKVSHDAKCGCSDDWRRTFIYYYTIALILIMVFKSTYLLYTDCANSDNLVLPITFALVSLTLGIIFIVVTFQYTAMLKKRNCSCATQGLAPKILKAIAIIQIIAISLSIIAFFFIMIMIMQIRRAMQNVRI